MPLAALRPAGRDKGVGMKSGMIRCIAFGVALCAGVFDSAAARADYTSFPAQGDYSASGVWGDRLWTFALNVSAPYQPYFQSLSLPGYSNGVLTSPQLYDANNINIGQSSPFVGSAGAGVAVGSANLNVKDSALTAPAGWSDTGGRKIYTSINSIDALDGGNQYELKIGTAASDQPASVGEMQAISGSGNPANDFPAQSFFDIFADVTIPTVGTFYNTAPAITSYNATFSGAAQPGSSPDGVQYFQHTFITAPTVYARADNGNIWFAGDSIGTLQLIPFGGVATLPEPASMALLGAGACGLLLRRQRR
jgi:hypothetical protein